VLATVVVGVAGALSAASAQTTALDVDARAVSMARQLMERIAARSFDAPASGDQPGYAAGSSDLDTYDDIADFDGYFDTVGPTDPSGPPAARASYARAVSVQFRSAPAGPAVSGGDLALVTVTVSPSAARARDSVVLRRLFARFPVSRD
jgi:hypothetical protein